MITINEWLNDFTDLLNELYGLPGIALVGLLCLMAGYCLKLSKRFPNDAIPLVLVVVGAALMPLLANFRESPLPLRVWLVRNVVVGAIIGMGTWLFHKVIVKPIEDKVPWVKNLLEDEPPEGTKPP